MSDLEELARGVVVVGFDGTTLDRTTVAHFARAQFAGYVLFARNTSGPVEETRMLTEQLRSLHESTPIIAVDQEGGRVARIGRNVETIPSMMSLGAADDAVLAERAGEQTGFDLRRAGLNVDFAPVIDVARDPRNTVIGTRAFASTPKAVVRLGGAFARGLEAYGIVATFKHFPGHGATASDSHTGLPVTSIDEATLRADHLSPFASLAPSATAIMTAHLVATAFDAGRSATLSQRLLTGVLRDELAFSGVCFTDCLQMDAIARSVGTAGGAAAAVAAGADCVLVSHDAALAERAANEIARAVERGDIARERLSEAHARVSALRSRLADPLPVDADAPHRGIGREIARHAVTLLRGTAHADPTACVVLSFESATTEGAQGSYVDHSRLEAQAPALTTVVAPLAPVPGDCERALEAIAQSGRRPIVMMRRAHIYSEQREAVAAALRRFPDAVVVSAREPYDCALFPQARHVLAIYGDDEASIGGLADVLFGNIVARGTLPVTFA